jgi:4-hydroxybenzoate polyprenyltransferase
MARSALKLRSRGESVPLCVDMDGTLLATDTLLEQVLVLLKQRPLYLLALPFIIALRGPRGLKAFLVENVTLPPDALPVRKDVLSFLKAERKKGRKIYLVTGARKEIAEGVAEEVGLFAEVLASDPTVNLVGVNKAQALEARFGAESFDYIGDSDKDLPVWKIARQALVVGSREFSNRIGKSVHVAETFEPASFDPFAIVEALRPHQWTKNLLLFLPLVFALHTRSADLWTHVLLGFFAYCLVASSGYLLNDLADVSEDRLHPDKKNRPLCSGRIRIRTVLFLFPTMLVSGLTLAYFVNPYFLALVSGYFVLSALYTFKLKRYLFLDAVVLSSLYTLRIFAGGIAGSVPISKWLLMFALFIFVSLALIKRISELRLSEMTAKKPTKSRGYQSIDLAPVTSLASASCVAAMVVFCLYAQSAETARLYRHPDVLNMMFPFLFYWLSRIVIIAHRGELTSDPIVFVIKDKATYALGIILATIWFCAGGGL